jgi:hypothetical protein
MVGLLPFEIVSLLKGATNLFYIYEAPPSIVEECHLRDIVLTLCHIFCSSVHVQHYPIDEFGKVSLYRFP